LAFFTQKAAFYAKNYHNTGFQEKRHYLCFKIGDLNIGPRFVKIDIKLVQSVAFHASVRSAKTSIKSKQDKIDFSF
jgi:hypothetical protein